MKEKETMTLNERKIKWDKEHTSMISVKLQNKTDADILQFLEGKQKQTTIKLALREYMRNHEMEEEN